MNQKPENVGVIASGAVDRRKRKRQVVVELYRREVGGRLVPNGAVVTEYVGERRGGAVRELSRYR